MLQVHHLNNSRSHRILWLLEELGLDYEVVAYQRDVKTMFAPAELRAVHPLGKSPVIRDDGRVLAESGAIIEYLLDRYGAGRLVPARGSDAHLRYLHWLHFAEGSAMPPLLLKLYFGRIGAAAAPLAARVEGQIADILSYLETELAAAAHLAGPDFTAADIQMSFPVEIAASRGGLGAERPKLAAWLEGVQARPAYRRAVERGGPYAFAR